MTQEQNTEDKPASDTKPKNKLKPELIFAIIFVGIIVGAIAAMMYIESVGTQRIGDETKLLHEAADR
ncbi:MAG TPA: hypothetical protein VFW68_13190 [Rhodocyclaceae bacterium]|nr:hypothetical protein [Rhodocyclaceae bacterium]